MTVISEKQDDFEVLANNSDTKDLEDGLQMLCAKNYSLDYIITRNVKDFALSSVPAIEPFAFLELLSDGTEKRI